jgi:abequosyltransferase
MKIKLSFCIPTYNFSNFIGETLESIISQATDEVEIVIVDGASTDSTPEVVSEYQKKFSRIRYLRRDKNMGVDIDMDKSIEIAEGEYCWLLSSDDKLKTGVIKRIISEINYGYDIYLCNRIECDFKLRPIKDNFWLSPEIEDRVFTLSDRSELFDYLNKSRSIGALFSYCSSIIFKRQRWSSILYNDKFTGTGYAHVYKLFSFIDTGCKLKYIKESLVFCRGDNDSFLAQGTIKRFLLDIDGYGLLADSFFYKDTDIKNAFLKIMKGRMPLHYLIETRSSINDVVFWNKIETKLRRFGFSSFTLYLVRTLGSLKLLVSAFLYIKKLIKNNCVFRKINLRLTKKGDTYASGIS